MEQTINPHRIISEIHGLWRAQTLSTAVEIGLFDFLGNGPKSCDEICKALEMKNFVPEDFLDALVSMNHLEKSTENLYSNAKDIQLYCVSSSPLDIGAMIQRRGDSSRTDFQKLTRFLKDPVVEFKNFDSVYADPKRAAGFANYMASCIRLVGEALPKLDYWTKIKTFADIGGCSGYITLKICQAHPHLTGFNADLPQLVPVYESQIPDDMKERV